MFDIILDDGSHISEHIITSFTTLFSELKPGGLYVIEDTQTSYWGGNWRGSNDLHKPITTQNYFALLTHVLNSPEFNLNNLTPIESRLQLAGQVMQFKDQIESIQFFHNIIVVKKAEIGQQL